jgi:cystathionine beta-lyase/cystathionine gamma-synthase
MITIETGSVEAARKVVGATRLFQFAESLGGVESLIGHPTTMTHASVPVERREAMLLSEGIVRLSCGVEDGDDLIADLEQALAQA